MCRNWPGISVLRPIRRSNSSLSRSNPLCERFYLSYRDEADSRYEHADGLVGVYREQEENSSKTLSLDLRKVSYSSSQETEAKLQYVE